MTCNRGQSKLQYTLNFFKRCLFNKRDHCYSGAIFCGLWEYAAFQRRYAARRPEWSLCSQLAPGKCRAGCPAETSVADSSLPTVLFPAEPTARQKKHDG